MELILIYLNQAPAFDTMEWNQSGWFNNFRDNFWWKAFAKFTS
jgi:hypothetical protein